MTLFTVFAALLAALSVALLVWPLLKPSRPVLPGEADANLGLLREQYAALDQELASGALTSAEHAASRNELARRALDEGAVQPARAGARPGSSHPIVIAVLLVPALAGALYFKLGSPAALDMAAASAPEASEPSMAQVEAMVSSMAARLEKLPAGQSDPTGWAMLARSLAALQRFPEADQAYARAIEASPRNAQLMADRADLLTFMQSGQGAAATDEPARLIAQALFIEPDNLKALALAGSAAFEGQAFDVAIRYWARARALAPAGSEFAASLDRSLAAAQSSVSASGSTAVTGANASQAVGKSPAPAGDVAVSPGKGKEVAAAGTVQGTVSISAALRERVRPGDTLYVFARAAGGPRMPLAILRLQATSGPVSFTLDDSLAMSPQFKLSSFAEVIVQARVSRSGDALPQAGDMVGQTGPVKPGSGPVNLVIDQVQP
ncbi:MAG: c-type cytochrome biogenesis protein CcmI [Pseudomonadota bacterium]